MNTIRPLNQGGIYPDTLQPLSSSLQIYTVGANSNWETGEVFPADTLQTVAKDEGMQVLIQKIMRQLNEVTGLDIEDPDWARIQPWTSGVRAL